MLSQALAHVRYTPLVSVTAFVEKRSFPIPPQGVGVLLPEGTSRKSLGVLFNSSSFKGRVADEGRWVSMTLMMGGSTGPEIVDAKDAQIQQFVRADLEKILTWRRAHKSKPSFAVGAKPCRSTMKHCGLLGIQRSRAGARARAMSYSATTPDRSVSGA